MILGFFAKKKVAVLIAVKIICENLSTVWVSDLVPRYAPRKWHLNGAAAGPRDSASRV
jgi:hypothetical protein